MKNNHKNKLCTEFSTYINKLIHMGEGQIGCKINLKPKVKFTTQGSSSFDWAHFLEEVAVASALRSPVVKTRGKRYIISLRKQTRNSREAYFLVSNVLGDYPRSESLMTGW